MKEFVNRDISFLCFVRDAKCISQIYRLFVFKTGVWNQLVFSKHNLLVEIQQLIRSLSLALQTCWLESRGNGGRITWASLIGCGNWNRKGHILFLNDLFTQTNVVSWYKTFTEFVFACFVFYLAFVDFQC